jgi:hypothetical protein
VTGSSAFNFQPSAGSVTGPAFSVPFKVIAVVVLLLACAWGLRLWQSGVLAPSLQSYGWVAAALAMMGYTVWHLVAGKTTLDAQCIQQTWVWAKRMELANLAYAKLIRVKGLEWLIAPRLYTRSFSGKLAVFYTSDPVLLADFERLSAELKVLRNKF